jgi:4-diphosphocytidyl-2-C-methyl-D-erythritol kinase
MIEVEAYAKINWALWITGRRPNGYHELDMLMQPVALSDRLAFDASDELTLTVDGEPSADPNNLVLRAARALREHAGARRGARVSLTKRIPVRAGLGGGSADCAAALRALNALWKLDLPDEALRAIGLTLGADVPYCLTGGFCRVRGIGESVEKLPGGPRAHLALMRLGDGLSTADVFRAWDETPVFPPMDPVQAAEAIRSGDYDILRAAARNALTAPAATLLPEIPEKIQQMYALGALYAQMSGSGSTVYGVFPSAAEARRAAETLGKSAIVTETLPL